TAAWLPSVVHTLDGTRTFSTPAPSALLGRRERRQRGRMTSDEDPPSIYVAHDLDDLFNALPTFLGFKPEESIVAVATHGPRRRFGFRLRIDVPTAFADVRKAADEVLYHL